MVKQVTVKSTIAPQQTPTHPSLTPPSQSIISTIKMPNLELLKAEQEYKTAQRQGRSYANASIAISMIGVTLGIISGNYQFGINAIIATSAVAIGYAGAAYVKKREGDELEREYEILKLEEEERGDDREGQIGRQQGALFADQNVIARPVNQARRVGMININNELPEGWRQNLRQNFAGIGNGGDSGIDSPMMPRRNIQNHDANQLAGHDNNLNRQ